MFIAHLPLLACPACQGPLRHSEGTLTAEERLLTGALACGPCAATYPVVSGVPRFVPRENYASQFGLEWTRHARTQYDSYSGIPISEQRFFGQTRWPRQMPGEILLEVGSGSGRFTEQAASTGATVVSLDFSYAVDANFASNGHRPNVLIVQADVFAMPFRIGTFDRIFCFGMLQHTPDPHAAFLALPRFAKPGGWICADIYKATVGRTLLHTKYFVRPVTRRMDPERLYALVQRWVDGMWPAATLIRKLPHGDSLNWRLLVADYSALGVPEHLLKEWAYLDTFDMLGPRYDRPATLPQFRSWGHEAGLIDLDLDYNGHGIALRGRTPATA